jgi:hypothetical protein
MRSSRVTINGFQPPASMQRVVVYVKAIFRVYDSWSLEPCTYSISPIDHDQELQIVILHSPLLARLRPTENHQDIFCDFVLLVKAVAQFTKSIIVCIVKTPSQSS